MHKALGIAAAAAAAAGAPGAAAEDGRGLSACVLPGHTAYPFCNTTLDVDARVRDLIGRIRAEDKPNLLTARGCRDCLPGGGGHEPGHQQALDYLGVPAYYWGTNCIHSAQMHNCTADGRCVTSFPSGPSLAAAFDPDLIRQVGGVVSTEVRAAFNARDWIDDGQNGLGLDCWSPVINLNSDPRWGRNGEGGAEDPKLMGDLGAAWAQGMQGGEDPRFVKVAVTLKHYIANRVEGSWLANGTWSPAGPINRHTIDVPLPPSTLADYYFRPFKAAIREGHAKGVMCSYNSVNGEPTCLSPALKNARDAWGFDGYVTSDSDSISDAYNTHHYANSSAQATGLGLSAGGCDIDSGDTYYHNIGPALKEGLVAEADVDRALFNSLRVRFALGLFDPVADQPYWNITLDQVATDAARELNQLAAQSSLVLLQNPGVLPLSSGQHKIAVVGPHALATNSLIEANTGRVCPSKDPGTKAEVDFDCVETPFAAIQRLNDAAAPGRTVVAPGCTIADPFNTSGVPAAVAAAGDADVVVMALGLANCGSYLGDPTYPLKGCSGTAPYAQYVEAEGHDRPLLGLPPAQLELARQVAALGKPTVVVLLNGGMVSLPDFLLGHGDDHRNDDDDDGGGHVAIMEAFYPGKEGADAIAKAIFGNNKWGRLPYTVYNGTTWVAAFPNGTLRHNMLDHDVAATRSTYRFLDAAVTPVLFPFGHGLSFSTFTLSRTAAASARRGGAGVDRAAPPPASSSVFHAVDGSADAVLWLATDGSNSTVLNVSVANNGPVTGDVVVQVFVQPPAEYLGHLHGSGGDVRAPQRALVAYRRLRDVTVAAPAQASFSLTARDLQVPTSAGDLVGAPGQYTVTVEKGDHTGELTTTIHLVGPQHTFEPFPGKAA